MGGEVRDDSPGSSAPAARCLSPLKKQLTHSGRRREHAPHKTIGGPERSLAVELDDETNEYGDVNGRRDLRDAVAEYYNHWFRQGKDSKYTAANVAIVPGGRAGLSRLMASLHNVNVGYFLPDYTAYQQLLGEFTGVAPIAIAHDQDGLRTSPAHLRRQIQLHGLGAFLWSNPANPTGEPIEGDTLRQPTD